MAQSTSLDLVDGRAIVHIARIYNHTIIPTFISASSPIYEARFVQAGTVQGDVSLEVEAAATVSLQIEPG